MKKKYAIIYFMTLCLILAQFSTVCAGSVGTLTVELKSGNRIFGGFTVNVWLVADDSVTPPPETSGAPTFTGVTDEDGKVSFALSEDGTYFVRATDNTNPARFLFTDFFLEFPYSGARFVVAAPKGETPGGGGGGGGGNNPRPPASTGEDSLIIGDDDPPLGGTGTQDGDDVVIINEDVPLADLPQTGVTRWPVPVLSLFGFFLILGGLLINRRESRNHA